MATLKGIGTGQLDPQVLALREGYVAYRDRQAEHWHTDSNAAAWAEERALWLAGETMVCTTSEVFDAAFAAGLDMMGSFTFAHDRDEQRHWSVPGREGGTVREVALVDGEWVDIGPVDNTKAVRQTRSQIARSGGNARWTSMHGA